MKTLVPDYVFPSFSAVTPQFLRENGIKALLSDVDNTLSPYEDAKPSEEVIRFIEELHQNGIKIALVSNNHYDRITLYNSEIGLPAFFDAGKPSRKAYFKAAKALAEKLQKHITDNFYTCTKEILSSLGQMYIFDERFTWNIDKHGVGTAEFVNKAIIEYCK